MQHRKKILILLSQAFVAGGIQRFNRTLLAACAQLPVACDVYSLADSPQPEADRLTPPNVTVRTYRGKKLRYAMAVSLAVLRGGYDIVLVGHVHLLELAIAATGILPGARPRVLLVAHGVELWTGLRGMRRRALRAAHGILCVSVYTRQRIQQQAPELADDRFLLFPNALDEAWVKGQGTRTARDPAATLPQRFILSVARLTQHDRRKGIVAVIEALASVEDTSVHYVVAGSGDDVDFLRQVARRCDVADRVHFPGQVSDDELVHLYRRCAAFVLPSGQEGFGIVFLEAMYFGAPVVAAREKGALDVIDDEETGLLVPYGDVVALKGAIDRLLSDEALRERLRGRALANVTGDGKFAFAAFMASCSTVFGIASPGRGNGAASVALSSHMHQLRLAIVTTHPIQYYAPLFRALARAPGLHPRVFYTWSQTSSGAVADRDFGSEVRWDIPLLEGYEHEFVTNVAHRPGSHRFRGIRNPELTHRLADWSPDALLVFGWNRHSHLEVMRRFKGRVPVLFRGDSTLIDAQPPWRRMARAAFLKWVYRYVDVAIAVGQNNRDYFAAHGLRPERIAFAPHAIDTTRFAASPGPDEERASGWRRELGIAADELVFLFAGKLIAKKDPFLLLDAFLSVDAPAHLVYCGNGALEAELKSRAAGHPRIHFMSFQNQRAMPAVYRLGDVFVLPSCGPGESWGLAINEAMACGRPVIASSRVGCARDLVRSGVNGWIFQSGDTEQLSRVLSWVASTDRRRLRSMGDESLRISQSWTTEEAARGIARAVTSFVAKAGIEEADAEPCFDESVHR